MGTPLALIGGAFMILMGYPPLAGILDTSTLSGLQPFIEQLALLARAGLSARDKHFTRHNQLH